MIETRTSTGFPVRFEIIELVEPELLVLRHEAMPELGLPVRTVARVELRDHGSKTRMTLTDTPHTAMMLGHAQPVGAGPSTSSTNCCRSAERSRPPGTAQIGAGALLGSAAT